MLTLPYNIGNQSFSRIIFNRNLNAVKEDRDSHNQSQNESDNCDNIVRNEFFSWKIMIFHMGTPFSNYIKNYVKRVLNYIQLTIICEIYHIFVYYIRYKENCSQH